MVCGSLSIRGLKSDSAVLCTDVESFELKEAETSNTLLIVPECQLSTVSLSSQPVAVNTQVHQPLIYTPPSPFTLPHISLNPFALGRPVLLLDSDNVKYAVDVMRSAKTIPAGSLFSLAVPACPAEKHLLASSPFSSHTPANTHDNPIPDSQPTVPFPFSSLVGFCLKSTDLSRIIL